MDLLIEIGAMLSAILITGVWIALVYEVTTALRELVNSNTPLYCNRMRIVGSIRMGICIMVFTTMLHLMM